MREWEILAESKERPQLKLAHERGARYYVLAIATCCDASIYARPKTQTWTCSRCDTMILTYEDTNRASSSQTPVPSAGNFVYDMTQFTTWVSDWLGVPVQDLDITVSY